MVFIHSIRQAIKAGKCYLTLGIRGGQVFKYQFCLLTTGNCLQKIKCKSKGRPLILHFLSSHSRLPKRPLRDRLDPKLHSGRLLTIILSKIDCDKRYHQCSGCERYNETVRITGKSMPTVSKQISHINKYYCP
jgi:hypothetical protein